MPALSPAHASAHIKDGISEYLTTSFSLAEPATAAHLRSFLQDPATGIFHGPYVRTRLPYAQVEESAGLLDILPKWFTPYTHQAEAFRRLRSHDGTQARRPEPTLVVTGTGSGKTESFLYPILDHCKRLRSQGVAGMKALILYPMNALANDQERRLAEMLFDPELGLAGVTAGIYTGEASESGRTSVSETGLITDRSVLRDTPPDILLTNYKMLDQLLLRDADQPLWENSATTIQYVVLDEFHTYDGAQGTDVALLLRRLGLQLKRFQPADFLSPEDAARPLGRITPVATSATLGSGAEGFASMLEFAHTVFGEELPASAVVSETLLSPEEWQASVPALVKTVGTPTGMPDLALTKKINSEVESLVSGGATHEHAVHSVLCNQLLQCSEELNAAVAAASQNELFMAVIKGAQKSIALDSDTENSLVTTLFSREFLRADRAAAVELLTHVLTEIAHLRSDFGAKHGWSGKRLPGVETHLWVREISRIERAVTLAPGPNQAIFRWSDDGVVTSDTAQDTFWLPAIYCRHCGRSGWMVEAKTDDGPVETNGKKIRRGALTARHQQRPLIDATSEAAAGDQRPDDASSVLKWLNMELAALSTREPDAAALEHGNVAPVLTYSDAEAPELALKQACPSCGEPDSIRFLGAAVATLLSVGISNLFGMKDLDSEEKKTLVFADSVQDAAHRAGFVESRAQTFALRGYIRDVVNGPVSIAALPDALMARADAADIPGRARFELLTPQLSERPGFKEYWAKGASASARARAAKSVRNRLALDLALEFGDRADLARSLVSTGTLGVNVAVSDEEIATALSGVPSPLGVENPTDWVIGVLEAMRLKGGINHPWFKTYLYHDANPYHLNRREARAKGVPPFARGGAPHFPRSGPALNLDKKFDTGVHPLGSSRGFFARWSSRVLGISRADAAHLVTALFAELAKAGVLTPISTATAGTMYALEPERIIVTPLENPHALECDTCHMQLSVVPAVIEILDGRPCFTHDCSGNFTITPIEANYYRSLYTSESGRTVVAREHTGLIENEERLTLEQEFKKKVSEQSPNSPNVLVATPTLEMGIDIGDLSTVILSSMPRSVANYVQRVGRAGRLSGNSLVLAFIRGRGEALARLEHPLETIAGSVTAPAAYLSARDILHRQFVAYLLDSHTISDSIQPPRRSIDVFSTKKKTVLDLIGTWVAAGISNELDAFCSTIAAHTAESVRKELREWATTRMLEEFAAVRSEWNDTFKLLQSRLAAVNAELPELIARRENGTAEAEDIDKYRAAKSAQYFLNKQLKEVTRDEYWISAMERYGLLPNFTLLDDTVEFQLVKSIYDFDTGDYANDMRSYSRGVSSALHELAPGATFYVQQTAARIDSVEIGPDGSSIQQWRFCPQCSYSEISLPGSEVPMSCPSCGSSHFADQGQLMDVVEMTKVYASVDEERSSIDTFTEQRLNSAFQSHLSFVIPEGGSGPSWFLSGSGFGVNYLPRVTMRWVNLGPVGAGHRKTFAATEIEAPLFRVCRHCGHIDMEADKNSWRDHKAWCSHRHAPEEDSVSFALARTLATQGVLLHVPPLLSAADTMTMPSLVAALKYGFKQFLGGDPRHLSVEPVRTKSAGKVIDVLLLHDTVPGGTGYLAQFAQPEKIRQLLSGAYDKLAHCRCTDDGRLACPDCLLPFAGNQVENVSRAAAAAAIGKILADDLHPPVDSVPSSTAWEGKIVEGAPETSNRSDLESRFLEQLRYDLTKSHAMVKTRTVGQHSRWTITFPDSKHIWYMEEQVDFDYTKPDFLFKTDASHIRDIAVFLDGAEYHISSTHFRFPSDVEKRNQLYRDERIIPWSMTWQDLDNRDLTRTGLTTPAPVWYDASVVPLLAQSFNLPNTMLELLARDPMTQLLSILRDPTSAWDKLATAAMFQTRTKPQPFYDCVHVGLDGANLTLTMDLKTPHVEAETWNMYLSMANLFYLQEDSSLIRVNVGDSPVEVAAVHSLNEHIAAKPVLNAPVLSEEWAQIIAEFDGEPEAVDTLTALASSSVGMPDKVGAELGGIPTIAMWTSARIAVVYPGEADDFVSSGFTVVEASEGFDSPELISSLSNPSAPHESEGH